MKHWIIALLLPATLLGSCKINNAPTDYLPLVVGGWVATQIDQNLLYTDSISTLTLNPDFTASIAAIKQKSETRQIWDEINNLSYTVVDNIISITSTPGADRTVKIRLEIVSVSPAAMICKATQYSVDGRGPETPFIVQMEKCYGNLRNQIIGIWQSNVVSEGVEMEWYWNFKIGGRYDFYIYDPASKSYRIKSLDKSSYKIYGRYLVCIYGEQSGETTTDKINIWVVSSFSGTSMAWASYASPGNLRPIYRLGLVGELP